MSILYKEKNTQELVATKKSARHLNNVITSNKLSRQQRQSPSSLPLPLRHQRLNSQVLDNENVEYRMNNDPKFGTIPLRNM